MKKIIIIAVAVIILLVSAGVIYLNRVVLPQKIKAALIKGIGDALQKEVSLESLKFNIFKGLVLRGLVISDENAVLLKVKEVSCPFFILPFFKKQVIVPYLRIKSPLLFLERRKDGVFNISGLFVGQTAKPAAAIGSGFKIVISRVSISGGRIDFLDNTCSPAFNIRADKFNLVAYLSLPAKAQFNLKFEIPQPDAAAPATKAAAKGTYNIAGKSMSANVMLQDLAVSGLNSYCRASGVSLIKGNIDTKAAINLKNDLFSVVIDGMLQGIVFSKDKISGSIDAAVKAGVQYSFNSSQLGYSGSADITAGEVAGIEQVGKISGIRGRIDFSPKAVYSEGLNANVFGLPITIKAKLDNFRDPLIDLNAVTETGLAAVFLLLKDRFSFDFPFDTVSGSVKLSVDTKYQPSAGNSLQLSGTAGISNAGLKLKNSDTAVEAINGALEFTPDNLRWGDLKFKYLDTDYLTSGVLTGFKSPAVQLKLSSQDLELGSAFSFTNNRLAVSDLSGSYKNSQFLLSGIADFSDPPVLGVEAQGELDIDLKDLKSILKKSQEQLDKIDPRGVVHVEGKVEGNIKAIKSCYIEAGLSSGTLSFYGLKTGAFNMDYQQENGIADIPLAHLSFYDGSLDATAKMNLGSENLPYWINAAVQGVNLGKLKNDTSGSSSDLAGLLQAQVKLNGFSNDLSKLSGAGTISITEGKLWKFNFFKGLGALLFTSDFTNVVFNEGSCGFNIQNKYVYTDNLKLTSNLVVIAGQAKVGFDGSLDAALNTEVLPEAPLTGTVKDVTTAILGQATRVGIIRVSGTLKEPKFKFKPAVVDIIKTVKDIFFKQ